MEIAQIGHGLALTPAASTPKTTLPGVAPEGGPEGTFGQALGRAMDELNALETDANDAAVRLAAGEPIDLHDAVLALERASLGFQLALQTRNKLVEAYQDVMRMQV